MTQGTGGAVPSGILHIFAIDPPASGANDSFFP